MNIQPNQHIMAAENMCQPIIQNHTVTLAYTRNNMHTLHNMLFCWKQRAYADDIHKLSHEVGAQQKQMELLF